MRAEQRRRGRAIRRARQGGYAFMSIVPDLDGFQTRINAVLARLELAEAGYWPVGIVEVLGRFAAAAHEPNPRRPLIHNGRAPRRGGM